MHSAAGAVLALSASANAGIIIPAGDWTVDIGGNVNTFYTSTRVSGEQTAGYGVFMGGRGSQDALAGGTDADRSQSNITTGLLPNYLSVSGTTRQNDLDVAFTISINPGSSTTQAGGQGSNQENRQAFLTFGDKSWGSVKIGKDLGIFASDAILNDMTLLGVGAGAGGLAGNTTTLGRIGTGFMYADWKAQVAYTSPNFNGFQFTAGATQAFNAIAVALDGATSTNRGGNQPAFEAKASYSWAGDVSGKVWVSGISQNIADLEGITSISGGTTTLSPIGKSGKFRTITTGGTTVTAFDDERANAYDIGTNVNIGAVNLTGYYYQGQGIGQTVQLNGGFDASGKKRDSKGGYVQAKVKIPTGTNLGVSWGQSKLEANGGDNIASVLGGEGRDLKDRMWVIGAYHPLTKHLNLVAEYSDFKSEVAGLEGKGKTASLGAILFF